MRPRTGEIARSLLESARQKVAARLVLIDPDRATPDRAAGLARYLVEEQVRGAPKLVEWGIEAIPTGYLLIGGSDDSTVARAIHGVTVAV